VVVVVVLVVVVVVAAAAAAAARSSRTATAVDDATGAVVVVGDVVVVDAVVVVAGDGDWSTASAMWSVKRDLVGVAGAGAPRRVGATVPAASCPAPVGRGNARPGVANRRSGATARAIQSPRRTVGRSPPALCVLRTPPFLCGQVYCVGIDDEARGVERARQIETRGDRYLKWR
jgi:hypothetical protein